jgi:hypothetical protein
MRILKKILVGDSITSSISSEIFVTMTGIDSSTSTSLRGFPWKKLLVIRVGKIAGAAGVEFKK